MSEQQPPKEDTDDILEEITQLCNDNECMFNITSGIYEDGSEINEWSTEGPQGWNNAAGGYTTIKDCLQGCLDWLRSCVDV